MLQGSVGKVLDWWLYIYICIYVSICVSFTSKILLRNFRRGEKNWTFL